MKGIDVKNKLLKHGFKLAEIAKTMNETPQNLDSMLRAEDIKTGVLERIAIAINKTLYFFIGDEAQEHPLNSRFEDQLALYKENAEFYKKEIRERMERLEVSLSKLTANIERMSSQNHSSDILEKMNMLAAQVQALTEVANLPSQAAKESLKKKLQNQ